MKRYFNDLMETVNLLFAVFMGGLVVFVLLLPCFLP